MEFAGWLAASIVGGAGLIGACAYLWRVGRNLARVLNTILTIVRRELEGNHGSSMKDDMTGVAYTVGMLWRRVEDLERHQRRHHPDGL